MPAEATGAPAASAQDATPAATQAAPSTTAAVNPANPNAPVNVYVQAPAAQASTSTITPPTTAPVTPQTVTIPLEQLQAYTTAQAQLTAMQAEIRAQQEAAQQAQAKLLMEKGQLEEGLRLVREQQEKALAEARQQAAEIEGRAKSYALDGEVAKAMAGIQFANDRARKAFEQEVRSELLVEGQGTTFAVRTPTFQTPAQLVQSKIASGEYNFMLAPQGVGGTATPGQSSQTAPPAASPAAVVPAVQTSPNGPTLVNGKPVPLGIAWMMDAKDRIAAGRTGPSPLTDPSRPMGLGASSAVISN